MDSLMQPYYLEAGNGASEILWRDSAAFQHGPLGWHTFLREREDSLKQMISHDAPLQRTWAITGVGKKNPKLFFSGSKFGEFFFFENLSPLWRDQMKASGKEQEKKHREDKGKMSREEKAVDGDDGGITSIFIKNNPQ